MYAQLPCVIVTYIPGKDLVAAKIGISRKGCSKRPIYIQLRRFQLATAHGVIPQECTNGDASVRMRDKTSRYWRRRHEKFAPIFLFFLKKNVYI